LSKPYPPTLRPEVPHTDEDTLPSGLTLVSALKAEIMALRARVAELEAERAGSAPAADARPSPRSSARDAAEQQFGESWHLLLSVVDNSPTIIFVKDRQGRYLVINRAMEELLGRTRDQMLNLTDDDILLPENAAITRQTDQQVLEAQQPIQMEETLWFKGSERTFLALKFPVYDQHGALAGLCGVCTDITDQKRREAEHAALREQLIAAQQDALRELSTPLVPIADGVLAMPIVGTIDGARADQIMETLLDGVGSRSAHTAILDITGVRVVDTAVADALVRAARAARLLGARVMITGIRGEVAQTLVHMGVDLGDIVTLSTLQSGIAFALRR